MTCGADWYTANNADSKRSYAITVDEADVLSSGWVVPEEWAELPFTQKVKTMNNLADSYVVAYVAKEGGLPKEVAAQRLAELRG